MRSLSCQTQTDRPCTAVQVEHTVRGRIDGILYRALIQPLCLYGVDLIKRLRRERERQSAEPVGQLGYTPERIKIPGKHDIALLLVDIEHNAGQLRAMLAQVCNKFLRLRAEAACRDDAKHGVGRVHGAAREQMAHCAAPCLLIIGGDAAQIHPVADCLRRLVCERELEQTLLDRRDIVAGCAVKALDHAAVFHTDGVNRLIAIAERVFHADDILQRRRNAADACERIVDTRSLHAQLFAVIHVLQAAAAAGAADRAGRLCARSGRGQALLRLAVNGGCRDLEDAHLPRLADERALNKHGAAGDMAHTGAFGRVPGDLGGVQLVFCKLVHGFIPFPDRRCAYTRHTCSGGQ